MEIDERKEDPKNPLVQASRGRVREFAATSGDPHASVLFSELSAKNGAPSPRVFIGKNEMLEVDGNDRCEIGTLLVKQEESIYMARQIPTHETCIIHRCRIDPPVPSLYL